MPRRNRLAAFESGTLADRVGRRSSSSDGSGPEEHQDQSPADPPQAVYYPPRVDGMKMIGHAERGGYGCALAYTHPHRFWLVSGSHRNEVEPASEASVHLMAVVWDAETGVVVPDLNPQLKVTRGGETSAQLAPWPMLSQPMGFHFGDNVRLDGDGSYRVKASVAGPSIRRTEALAESTAEASFAFDFAFEQSALEELMSRDVSDEKQGTSGAVEPMEMQALPSSQAPAEESLPGELCGTATSGDAAVAITLVDDATPYGGSADEAYVAVSPRTPHNRYMLPLTSLSGTLKRSGETAFDGAFLPTLSPELRHHYGAVVPGVQSGDRLTITVDAAPQIARTRGYETAFFETNEVTIDL